MSTNSRPYGVLGRTLAHSYTPVIYHELAGLDYRKFEREPDQLEAFVHSDAWEGFNVTIPYKRDLMSYMDKLSPIAQRMGNINTVTRLSDGRLRGDNTDYYGFKVLVESLQLDLAGKKALVFGGNGGAGSTAMMVLADLGMRAVSVNRSGDVTYADLAAHADAALAVNCTPVGMFPSCPAAPCTLEALPHLEGLVDIVYNPARTALMMEAERRGIACAGGLLMLVAQAAQAVERYTGDCISLERIYDVAERLSATEQNITLIGMPGCGKTRVGERLSELTGRERVDIDHVLEELLGMSCAEYIGTKGEAAFREQEHRALREVSSRSGLIISCGGGVVTREENYELLHQNSQIVMLNRPLAELSKKGRPITARDGIETLAEQRMPIYRSWADVVVNSLDCAEHTAQAVLDALPKML
ncbi:MAG: shikimate kinase [Coriobacteriaceae bacterium]|nr:shikimate kinase [Coriobacteriaceae bacterium]